MSFIGIRDYHRVAAAAANNRGTGNRLRRSEVALLPPTVAVAVPYRLPDISTAVCCVFIWSPPVAQQSPYIISLVAAIVAGVSGSLCRWTNTVYAGRVAAGNATRTPQ